MSLQYDTIPGHKPPPPILELNYYIYSPSTPGSHRAPELFLERPHGPSVDIFAFGVLLNEMLAREVSMGSALLTIQYSAIHGDALQYNSAIHGDAGEKGEGEYRQGPSSAYHTLQFNAWPCKAIQNNQTRLFFCFRRAA